MLSPTSCLQCSVNARDLLSTTAGSIYLNPFRWTQGGCPQGTSWWLQPGQLTSNIQNSSPAGFQQLRGLLAQGSVLPHSRALFLKCLSKARTRLALYVFLLYVDRDIFIEVKFKTMKLTHNYFKVCNSVASSPFTVCCHLLCVVPGHFFTPKGNPIPVKQPLPMYPSLDSGSYCFLSEFTCCECSFK